MNDENEKEEESVAIQEQLTFHDALAAVNIRECVEEILFRRNTSFSRLRTVVDAHKSILRCFFAEAESLRTSIASANEREETLLRDASELAARLKENVDVIDCDNILKQFMTTTSEIIADESSVISLQNRLVELQKKMKEWSREVRKIGPLVSSQLIALSEDAIECELGLKHELEKVRREARERLSTLLIHNFQRHRLDRLRSFRAKIREEHEAAFEAETERLAEVLAKKWESERRVEELGERLDALEAAKRRLPLEGAAEQRKLTRELKGVHGMLSALERHLSRVETTRAARREELTRLLAERRCSLGRLSVSLSLTRARLCRTAKKATAHGVNIHPVIAHLDNGICTE